MCYNIPSLLLWRAELRMFNLFKIKPTVFDRIDNPGGGDCGYYALMMGIIHLAKSPETSARMQETIANWKRLDPAAIADIDTALTPEIQILDKTQNQELMYRLQKSLRKILANKYILSIPERVEQMVPRDDAAFAQFQFLVEQVHPGAQMIHQDILANPLCQQTSQPVKEIALAIDERLEQLKYPHNPKYQKIVHHEFIAASFIRFRERVIAAYEHHYVGSQNYGSHAWATEKCLVTLADCLVIPIQILTNGQPSPASNLGLNEMGVRLNNEGNAHWTLYLPKQNALEVQAPVDVHHQEVNIGYIADKRNQLVKERQKLNAQNRDYLVEKEPNLDLNGLFNQLDAHQIEALGVDDCNAVKQQYSDLLALHGAHAALDLYMARYGEVPDRQPYDEQYLRLELQRCRLKFDVNLTEENKRHFYNQIDEQKDQLRAQTIREIRDNQEFQRQVAELRPKVTIRKHEDVANNNSQQQNRNFSRRRTKLGNRKPSSAYPGYALNGCLGGLILGALIVGSSPELVAVTAAALSFSPIGAVFTLLLVSMFIATLLTLLTLYLMDKCKPSVASSSRIG
ncbi:MAG: hypothetical protein EBQ95_01615 [Gammaproteobacteria bacterium]|nr:hypothetical protein [Gammaproteobacteria bacterium]